MSSILQMPRGSEVLALSQQDRLLVKRLLSNPLEFPAAYIGWLEAHFDALYFRRNERSKNLGPVGPQGPAGATGATGATGPPGPVGPNINVSGTIAAGQQISTPDWITGGGLRLSNNFHQLTGNAAGFFGHSPISQPRADYTSDANTLAPRLWTALRDLGLIQNV